MRDTFPLLQSIRFPVVSRRRLETVQANLGYRCNQACVHCHVDAGPKRTEMMDSDTVALLLRFLETSGAETLDLTGGAPELNPHFRDLVRASRGMGNKVIDRCNLTIIEEPGQEDLADFLAEHEVEIVASLPCYLEQNVDRQRGDGVFAASLRGLRKLNALGYGATGSGRILNLVYNPQGPNLPPPEVELEADYRRELYARYQIVFNRLYALANLPIRRFGHTLLTNGQFDAYMELLRTAHKPQNLDRLMCRSLVSVDWQGYLYDCDFNQMLNLSLNTADRRRVHLSDLESANWEGRAIRVAGHCYGCTAGAGSSCSGALAD